MIDTGHIAAAAPSTTGTLTLLNGVATGTDYNQRIGRSIFMTELELRLAYEPDTAASATAGDTIRTLVVYDMQASGAAPTTAAILQSADYTEPYQVNSRDRFLILYDDAVPLSAYTYTAGALSAGDPAMYFSDESIPLSCTTTYSGTGATISSITTGSLYLLQISAKGVWKSNVNSRVIFFDS